MEPILLIHGYSSDGYVTFDETRSSHHTKNIKKIYGNLPKLLKKKFGNHAVQMINLSRWISLDDGVTLDDISFAMQRALMSPEYRHLMETGFHVVIHSTGALVVRNWIKKFSPKPCPIKNLVHLAGANFGSGLAHIGRGQLARWGRFIFQSTQPGSQILNELEFGCSKTLDLHCHFLQPENKMREDYEVQEFLMIGSQVGSGVLKPVLETIPIRYVKEDSSDNTVRAAASNLNFNHIKIIPNAKAYSMSARTIMALMRKREDDKALRSSYYDLADVNFADERTIKPFAVLYEASHFGEDTGIVDGKKTRSKMASPLIAALKTKFDEVAYQKVVERYDTVTEKTLARAAKSKRKLFSFWNKQQQYEAHAQIIFRLRDQYARPIKHYDITFNSKKVSNDKQQKIEWFIEDKHRNLKEDGILTFYLRVVSFDKRSKTYINKMDSVTDLDLEITAYENGTDRITFVPINYRIEADYLRKLVQPFRTTLVDIEMARLPGLEVFDIIQH